MEKQYKYISLISIIFVVILLTSNITSTKITSIGPFTFDGGTILFPLSYIFGDILTEVYGYKQSRKVIWMGFIGALIMAITIIIVGMLPPSPDWAFQKDYDNILGLTPRLVIASLIAYIAGEFSNSYVLAKMKIWTKGKILPARTISSTLVGELLDTSIFISVAFYGIIPNDILLVMFTSNYIFKVGIEVVFTPLTVLIVRGLKKSEHEDYFDTNTDFNPLKVFS